MQQGSPWQCNMTVTGAFKSTLLHDELASYSARFSRRHKGLPCPHLTSLSLRVFTPSPQYAIVLEDDLEVSVVFFDYMCPPPPLPIPLCCPALVLSKLALHEFSVSGVTNRQAHRQATASSPVFARGPSLLKCSAAGRWGRTFLSWIRASGA